MPTPAIPHLTKLGEKLVVVWVNPDTRHVERQAVLMQAPTWWRGGKCRFPSKELLVEMRLLLKAAAHGCNSQPLIDALAELDELACRLADLVAKAS